MQRRLIKRLRRRRNIERRVLGEEAIGLQHHADSLNGHHGEVLDAGVVR